MMKDMFFLPINTGLPKTVFVSQVFVCMHGNIS